MSTRRYEIRVAGLLSARSRAAFPDMTVADAPPETVISGEILDDSHLHGVLALLRSMGLRVVSMHEVGRDLRPQDPIHDDR
ncbi:hypothetical protein [Pseudonocardia sp. MH-G8]|uniref:hypothetical protein n=1 Tax=Pseudonocardia sp. MH-G8 TaxID=1854588 RepID=UPI000BA0DF6E|nr:hypothetical protein [Pseudonocardia sp. MH-G8]OZM84314.1 hypothetical protein CFP66_03315 [Pseudonocardia sp. MH-G8]